MDILPDNLLAELERWRDRRKYGNIQINFAGGEVINFSIHETKRASRNNTENVKNGS